MSKDTTDLREQLADVLMTPNQAWRGIKNIPIELIWGLEQLISNREKLLLDRVEKELQLGDGYGEVHVSHVCPQDNVECAKSAQRGQTQQWQRQKLATLRKELDGEQ